MTQIHSDSIRCHMLYDAYKRKNESFKTSIILFICTILLTTICCIIVGLMQAKSYSLIIRNNTEPLGSLATVCWVLYYGNFEMISTPLATFLTIFFIILYKRRTFLVNRCGFRHIGLPMIVSCWSKTDRFFTACIYGRMSLEVFTIFSDMRSKLFGLDTSIDPTGILRLLIRIFHVFVIGVRFYPVLVAFRAKETVFYIFTSLFMCYDLFETVFALSACDFVTLTEDEIKANKRRVLGVWLGYKSIESLPTIFFSSYAVVNLTYRSIRNLIHYGKRAHNQKSNCCSCLHSFLNIDDDNETFYSQRDLDYVINLLNNRQDFEVPHGEHEKETKNERNKVRVLSSLIGKLSNDLTKTSSANGEHSIHSNVISAFSIDEPKPIKQRQTKSDKICKIFRKNIYDWQSSFKFSSRFVNIHIVGLLTLFHLFVTLMYVLIKVSMDVNDALPDDENWEFIPIDVGELICLLGEDFCVEGLKNITEIRIPYPRQLTEVGPTLKGSIITVLIVPACIAIVITLIQFFLGLRDCRTHLLQLYKGECDYVPGRDDLANTSIAAASFHFGGYLVGYLVWGYGVIFLFLFLLACLILFLRIFVGDVIFWQMALKLMPVVVLFIIKKFVNILTSRFIFLHRNTRILAVDNFRAFNVFLYFSFFFDCFMGIVSAILRIIKSALAGVFMMPRISYGFLGRKLERMDNGYSTYVGFLYMEAAHTNPVLLSFCSVLYYKGLSDHIKHILKQKRNKSKNEKYIGVLLHVSDSKSTSRSNEPKKVYKKSIVNKWHVILMLAQNPSLVFYRKNNEYNSKRSEAAKPQSHKNGYTNTLIVNGYPCFGIL